MNHLLNHFVIEHFKNKELDEFYASVFLRTLAESLIGIFVPIYLYTLGFSLQYIAVYFAIYYAAVALFTPLSLYLSSYIGIKKNMLIGTILFSVYYLSLNYISEGLLFYLIPLNMGIAIAVYYSGFHIEFTESCDKGEEGREFSILRGILIISTTLGPLVGSLFISDLSFKSLFTVVFSLLILSSIPLFFTNDRKIKKPKISLKNIWSSDTRKKAISYQAAGALDMLTRSFWPLFIFLVLGEVLSLGAIFSITAIIVSVFLYYIGKFSDTSPGKVLTAGITFHSISWISRLFFLTPMGIFLNNFLSSLSRSAIDVPFNKEVYSKAEGLDDKANYFSFREFNLVMGRVIILLILFLTGEIFWGFLTSFFFTLLYLPFRMEMKN